MRAFSVAMTARRRRNRLTASHPPSGRPMQQAIARALSVTRSERAVISMSSASSVTMRRNASASPASKSFMAVPPSPLGPRAAAGFKPEAPGPQRGRDRRQSVAALRHDGNGTAALSPDWVARGQPGARGPGRAPSACRTGWGDGTVVALARTTEGIARSRSGAPGTGFGSGVSGQLAPASAQVTGVVAVSTGGRDIVVAAAQGSNGRAGTLRSAHLNDERPLRSVAQVGAQAQGEQGCDHTVSPRWVRGRCRRSLRRGYLGREAGVSDSGGRSGNFGRPSRLRAPPAGPEWCRRGS